jgi:hypothetical protein
VVARMEGEPAKNPSWWYRTCFHATCASRRI